MTTDHIETALQSAKAAFETTADERVERLLAEAIGVLRTALELASRPQEATR